MGQCGNFGNKMHGVVGEPVFSEDTECLVLIASVAQARVTWEEDPVRLRGSDWPVGVFVGCTDCIS